MVVDLNEDKDDVSSADTVEATDPLLKEEDSAKGDDSSEKDGNELKVCIMAFVIINAIVLHYHLLDDNHLLIYEVFSY